MEEKSVDAQSTQISKAIIHSESIPVPQGVRAFHASTIAETIDGSLAVAYYGGSGEGKEDNKIWLTSCTGKERIWMPPVEVASSQEVVKDKSVACWNPVLFQLPISKQKTMFLLFYKIGDKPKSWSGFFKASYDHGKTWGKAQQLPAGIIGPAKNKPILINKRLVCPSSVESWQSWSVWFDVITIKALLKNSYGEGWQKVGPLCIKDQPYGVIQPTIFVVDPRMSTLFAICRTKNTKDHVLYATKSFDGGYHWSPLVPTNLQSNDSGIDGIKLKDGRMLLVYSDCPEGDRSKIDLAVSGDNGKTWMNVGFIEKGEAKDQIGYPSVIQAKDGYVHITYTAQHRREIHHVVLDPSKL
jgi:predicted neuraminidase